MYKYIKRNNLKGSGLRKFSTTLTSVDNEHAYTATDTLNRNVADLNAARC